MDDETYLEICTLVGKFAYNWSAFGMGFKYCIHCQANDDNQPRKIVHKDNCPVVLANSLLRKLSNVR